MKISISFPTIRKGWLENTFRALGNQSLPHQDWELVMIDDYGDRWEEVRNLAQEYEVNVKYMHSKPYYWKSNRQLGNARNTGFIHSDGELIVFLDDYSWVEPRWLEAHWRYYNTWGRAVIGKVQSVAFNSGKITSKEDLALGEREDERWLSIRPRKTLAPCPPGWFWTFNASAPLSKIILVNGYDEEFDCTGEDDVDLGLRLSKMGVSFIYTTNPEIVVYHMKHNGGLSRPSPFKPEECHRVTKDLYGTKYDGSWGLLERNSRRPPWRVNVKPSGEYYFHLAEARKERDKYPCKEWKI